MPGWYTLTPRVLADLRRQRPRARGVYEIALSNGTIHYPGGRSSTLYVGSSIARGARNVWARIRDHIGTARLANAVVYGYHAHGHALRFRVDLMNGVAARRAEAKKIRSFIRRFGCAPIGNHQNGRGEVPERSSASPKRGGPRRLPRLARPASCSKVAVYALYKGRRKEAAFSKSSGRIRYKGKEYSPSKAASRVCGGSAVNGWRFWRCRDPKTGQDRFIDDVFRDR